MMQEEGSLSCSRGGGGGGIRRKEFLGTRRFSFLDVIVHLGPFDVLRVVFFSLSNLPPFLQ